MRLYSSEQMRALDAAAITGRGIPSLTLMGNAAFHIVRTAEQLCPGENRSAAVFMGSGNNGGDGAAAGCGLLRDGYCVRLFLVGKRDKMTPDTAEYVRRFQEAEGEVESFDPGDAEMRAYVAGCGVIVDAMFGIGLNSDLRSPALDAAKLINASDAKVVAADIASGVEADTGRILGDAVRADVTVTFTAAKPGQLSEPGCLYTGRLDVEDIGIPKELLAQAETKIFAVTEGDVSLPVKPRDGYKGTFGRDLILAGSVGFTGAPALAAEAAVRSGAGLVFLGVPESIYAVEAVKCAEAMPFPLPDSGGMLALAAYEKIQEHLEKCSACLIGPGLGRSEGTVKLVQQVIRRSKVPLVIDADGIFAVSQNISILEEASCPIVLTPHKGEFRIMGGETGENRIGAARNFAMAHRCTLVYKGHRTVTACADGSVYINTTGNPGMGKGGSGDVLAGMLTALIGQGFSPETAAYTAVFLHGRAGDLCAQRLGEYAMTPSDMIGALPHVFQR